MRYFNAQTYNQSNAAGGSAATTSTSTLVGAFPNPTVANTPWLSTFGGFTNDPKYSDARSAQWHMNVERQFSSNIMVSVGYVGSKKIAERAPSLRSVFAQSKYYTTSGLTTYFRKLPNTMGFAIKGRISIQAILNVQSTPKGSV